MRTTILHAAALASIASAQTPPGFEPATSNNLPAHYGALPVTPGTSIPINSTVSAPTLDAPARTLTIMIDLDAPYPSNATYSPLVHWITPSPATANSTVPYVGPQPPPDSPAHRYVLLSYSLPSSYENETFVMPRGFENVGNASDATARLMFDLEGFVSAAGLEGPAAANWFLVAPHENTTATPPPEQFESAARKQAVGISMLGVVVLGLALMM